MLRHNTGQDVKNNSPGKLKKILSDVANFIIYDKSSDFAITSKKSQEDLDGGEYNQISEVEFAKIPVNDENFKNNKNNVKKYNIVKKKYIKSKKYMIDADDNIDNSNNISENFEEVFDSVKQEKQEIQQKTEKKKSNFSYGYGIRNYSDNKNNKNKTYIDIDANTKTKIPLISSEIKKQQIDKNSEDFEEDKKDFNKTGKINLTNIIKRFLILFFAVICGSITMPFGMNPLGFSIICAADKYIFYIYSGLVISLAFHKENLIIFLIIYTMVAGIKFYLRYTKEKAKVEMLSKSVSYNNLNKKEKIRLLNLVHFNDTGSVIMSVLVCAVSCCIIGFLKLALKTGSIIYTDIAVIMLFMLMSMLFTYLYSGLFDVGSDNKTLGKAGICAVIFTVIYFLAPYYLYTLSIGYIASFILTFIAANSGMNKFEKIKHDKNTNVGRDDSGAPQTHFQKDAYADEDINSDEEIISRFAVNLINQDGVLSDMTRGALVGLLCGVALGDTAGAVTLGICGLVSGLFFSQSTVLAIISGLVSAISYSVYVAGIDAIQRYIPNMLAGLTFYLPASMFYASFMRKIKTGKYDKKSAPLLDKGLLIAELPAKKLNNLSDAFQNLSGIFYGISEKFKTPNSNEIKVIVSACVEKTCEKCENYSSCELTEKSNINSLQKKCVDYLAENGRLNSNGITKIFAEQCVRISEIQNKINAVYCRKTEENIENNKTKIFADNYESIAKLLQNNIKSGKEDISFKKEMSEKIFISLENMGIECENVIVMGERKKTVYIFGIKMVNYSGTIADITDILERICGTWFDYPEYILRDNYIIMKNQSRNKFRIYSMQISKAAGEINNNLTKDTINNEQLKTESINFIDSADFAKEENSEVPQFESEIIEDTEIKNTKEEENAAEFNGGKNTGINGDSVSVFYGRDGYQYGLISDGMGSGKNAAISSRLTVLMTEKLLSAGNQKDLTVEMINSLLMSKSDECFASVDLFEADLITGKANFIKAGAAPSFVIRNNKLFKIQSSTVPAGIIENINSEQTKFDMEDGDYIIMLSDGIISTFEESAWLLEMLGSEKKLNDPKSLLNGILREASKKNHRKDDMSVLFMKIAEEKRMA